jgi:hypothetical protein
VPGRAYSGESYIHDLIDGLLNEVGSGSIASTVYSVIPMSMGRPARARARGRTTN